MYDYAFQFNNNTVLLPTVVDTDYYQKLPQKKNRKICIGWSGSHTTINHFKYLERTLENLKSKYGDRIEIVVFGDDNYHNEKLETKGIRWKKELELNILSSFDIGVMPLEENEWEKGKCGMKALLYMSMGVASVVSPVGVNTDIIKNEVNGFLARNEEEWFSILSLLIENKNLREKIGQEARASVEKSYSVNAYQQKFINSFNS